MAPAATPSPTYERLVAILERYISRIMVQSVLATALDQSSVTAGSLGGKQLTEVVERAMTGMRLFCDPARLPDLMIELAELCDEQSRATRVA